MAKSRVSNPQATEWFLINASGQRLGKIATTAATLLRGKHRLDFAPHRLPPVHVVVTNTDQLDLPAKRLSKEYIRHSQYLGHLKRTSLRERMVTDSTLVIRDAVQGMLSRNRLRRAFLLRLHPYRSEQHPYADKSFTQLTS